MKTTIEKIGPVTATKYLESAPQNRHVSPTVVNSYAKQMSAGQWRQTHQGIAFNEAGGLVDGQHRLHAIIKSGRTITMQVSRGLTSDDILVIDAGKTRTANDRLAVSGVTMTNGKMSAAIVATLLLAESGACPKLTPGELKAIYENNTECIEFAINAFGQSGSGWNAVIRGAFAYCYAFAPRQVSELARMVFNKEGLQAGTPAHTFVVAMANGKLTKTGATGRADSMSRALSLIRAHIEDRGVARAKASASVFTWAQQQRQLANVPTIAEVLA